MKINSYISAGCQFLAGFSTVPAQSGTGSILKTSIQGGMNPFRWKQFVVLQVPPLRCRGCRRCPEDGRKLGCAWMELCKGGGEVGEALTLFTLRQYKN